MASPELCDACGMVITDDSALYGLAPDSSRTHPVDPTLDGQRILTACSPEHLADLQREYAARPFIDEELWAGKITRALGEGPLKPFALAKATGLTLGQIHRAVAWRNKQR